VSRARSSTEGAGILIHSEMCVSQGKFLLHGSNDFCSRKCQLLVQTDLEESSLTIWVSSFGSCPTDQNFPLLEAKTGGFWENTLHL